MKSALFASPNLKAIIGLAALLVVLQQLVGTWEHSDAALADGRSQGSVQASELEQMLDETFLKPTAETYEAMSGALLRSGDVRGAMFYIRKAHLAATLEE